MRIVLINFLVNVDNLIEIIDGPVRGIGLRGVISFVDLPLHLYRISLIVSSIVSGLIGPQRSVIGQTKVVLGVSFNGRRGILRGLG